MAKDKAVSKYRDEDGNRLQTYKRFKEGVDYEPIDQEQMTALIEFAQHCHRVHKTGNRPQYDDIEVFFGICDAYWDVLREKNESGIKIIPDVEGFCSFAGISRETLNQWENTRQGAYSDAIKTLKNQFAFVKKQLALSGKIPPIVFATDFNNNHHYINTSKQDININAQPNPLGERIDPAEREAYIKSLDSGAYTIDD